MRILLTGATGQVGWELARTLSVLGEIAAPARAAFDLAQPDRLADAIDAIAPDLVVNPAAYTAVDRAETDRDAAFLINRDAPAAIARACARRGIGLVHFSTDYVHPGTGTAPWREDDEVGPVNVYGESKLAGEEAVRASGCTALIFRTSWVYGARGQNFLLTMLRIAGDSGKSGKPLTIVADQHGAPTTARLIATTVLAVLARSRDAGGNRLCASGTYNLAAGGTTTWHGFATEIFRLREALTGRPMPALLATDSAAFKTAARRPLNSRLALGKLEQTFDLALPDWTVGLHQVMADGLAPIGTRLGSDG